MKKTTAIFRSLGWTLLILVFPVASGVLSAVLSLGRVETLFLQGAFMVLALAPPVCLVLTGKWTWGDLGFGKWRGKPAYLLAVLLIFVPAAVGGFVFPSAAFVLGNLFLYAAVGLAEEIYFRAMIPNCLGRCFDRRGTVLLSSLIFALGHGAGAIGGMGMTETVLIIVNALLFGWMAMEMVILAGNILPAAAVHFFFDFETKIAALEGAQLLTAELVRGCVMASVAVYLAYVARKERSSAR